MLEGKGLGSERFFTLKEASKIKGISPLQMEKIVTKKNLKAYKHKGRWMILSEDLEAFCKFPIVALMHMGKLVFDSENGQYSVNDVAKMLNVRPRSIRHAIDKNHLKIHYTQHD
jgi:hypothetical protein